MKIGLIFLCLISAFIGQIADVTAQDSTEIYIMVEEMPVFYGCETEKTLDQKNICTNVKFYEFIKENTIYPINLTNKTLIGTSYVRFCVNRVGLIEKIEIAKEFGGEDGAMFDKEAIRVIKKLPRMKPGLQRGIPRIVQYTLPINFNK